MLSSVVGFRKEGMEKISFELTADYIELHKLLKYLGLAENGGAAKARVAAGEVSVDGAVELRKACKIRAGQVVETDEAEITILPKPE